MNDQILMSLKRKLDDLAAAGTDDVETQRNALKEELQYYVLNFIYHHTEYSTWTMYGGSALRICHGLDRMSVDLDFEVTHPITEAFLTRLGDELAAHFVGVYGAGSDLLTIKPVTGRGLLLRFHLGESLGIKHPSKQVHVKIDLNHFIAPKTTVERQPINRDQLSFVIRTYTMSTLMASKIAAIILRGQRGVGTAVYNEKGRDIYDLLWYMTKKIVPNLEYLHAKGVEANNPRALFDTLTLQMNKVSDANLSQDLRPLFVQQTYIDHWLQNWRETYLRLLDSYKMRTVTTLRRVAVSLDFRTEVYTFEYQYDSLEDGTIRIIYKLSGYWITFRDGDIQFGVNEGLKGLISYDWEQSSADTTTREKLTQYAALFHEKNIAYLQKADHIVFGDVMTTKTIRMTADGLNHREEILLNRSALLSSKLGGLLK